MVVTPKIIHNPYPSRNFCQCCEQRGRSVQGCCIAEILRNIAPTYLGSDRDGERLSGDLLAGAGTRRVFSDDSFVR